MSGEALLLPHETATLLSWLKEPATDLPPPVATILEKLTLHDGRRALANLRTITTLAGPDRSSTLLPLLAKALSRCPDADMALNNLERTLVACGDASMLIDRWLSIPEGLHAGALIGSTSQFLADILPETALALCDWMSQAAGPPWRSVDEMEQEGRALATAPNMAAERFGALRAFKRRELFRIGARDILRRASFGELVEEISDLAGVCLRVALDLCWEMTPKPDLGPLSGAPSDWHRRFVVIALGKLGARELNYSSDVDLLLAYDGSWAPEGVVPEPARRYFERLGHALIDLVGTLTGDGGLFRVDMRLRPEGRAGALVRTVEGYLTYYESYAAVWERQALIKASWVAGHRALADRLLRRVSEFVFGKRLDTSGIAEIKAVKARLEASVGRRRGGRDVKLGPGGIRDIEFIVQLLQLIFGPEDESVRAPSTLGALRALRTGGYLTEAEHKGLASAYVFLRTLEHQLQLMHGLNVRELPEAPQELNKLARRLEFPHTDLLAPGEYLTTEFHRHTDNVRELFGKLFASMSEQCQEGDLRARCLVLLPEQVVNEVEIDWLTEWGFHDPRRVLQGLRRLAWGTASAPLPASSAEQFADLVPRLLHAVAQTPDPDASLAHFERFCGLIGSHGALYSTLASEPAIIDLLVRVAGSSRSLSDILSAHPEYFDMLMDPLLMASSHSLAKLTDELSVRLKEGQSPTARVQAVARFRRRELLRVGVRDLMGKADIETIMAELSDIGQACLAALVEIVALDLTQRSATKLPFAVLGLGKLGGRELHYSSDLDVMFVWDEGEYAPANRQALFSRLASELMTRARAEISGEGPLLVIDARLRPEGQAGPLARSVTSYRDYYASRAETWERLALIRARHVAGNRAVSQRLLGATAGFLWGRGLDETELADILHIKSRLERERARTAPGKIDVKLGPGGIHEIEFGVQMLQLAYGLRHPEIRVPSTLGAIRALVAAGLFDSPEEAVALEAAYLFLRRVECRLQLVHAWDESVIEAQSNLEPLARLLDYEDRPLLSAAERLARDLDAHRAFVRETFERTVARLQAEGLPE